MHAVSDSVSRSTKRNTTISTKWENSEVLKGPGPGQIFQVK